MNHAVRQSFFGIVALLSAGIIGGLGGVFYKIVLRELPPFTTLALRIGIALLLLLPMALGIRERFRRYGKLLLLLSVFSTGNTVFFLIGVQHTTAIMSQLLYTGVPLFVLIENFLFYREEIRGVQIAGVFVGFAGILIVLFGSLHDTVSMGSLTGNSLILCSAMSWSLYLVFSKRLSAHVSPIKLSFDSIMLTPIIAVPLLFFFEGGRGFTQLPSLSGSAWGAFVFVAVGLGVAMPFFYQWGVKNGSSLAAGSMSYVSTLTAVIGGTVLLGEQMTVNFMAGGALALLGVFLTTTLPLIQNRTRSTVSV